MLCGQSSKWIMILKVQLPKVQFNITEHLQDDVGWYPIVDLFV